MFIYITFIMEVGLSLDHTADCICFEWLCFAYLIEVQPNSQVYTHIKTFFFFFASSSKMSLCVSRELSRSLPNLILFATVNLNVTTPDGSHKPGVYDDICYKMSLMYPQPVKSLHQQSIKPSAGPL
jgi:hypothetical protein